MLHSDCTASSAVYRPKPVIVPPEHRCSGASRKTFSVTHTLSHTVCKANVAPLLQRGSVATDNSKLSVMGSVYSVRSLELHKEVACMLRISFTVYMHGAYIVQLPSCYGGTPLGDCIPSSARLPPLHAHMTC